MKFLKGFLISLLTIWVAILIIVFGLVLNVKATFVNTVDGVIKREIVNGIRDVTTDYSEKDQERIVTEVEKLLDENESIKKILDTTYDSAMDIIAGKNTNIQVDITKDLENLVDDGIDILKDYDIAITEEQKTEIINTLNQEDVNEGINNALNELKNDMQTENQTLLDVVNFITGVPFKIILLSLIIVALLFIALLEKSTYKWLQDFGIAILIDGIMLSFVIPFLADYISKNLLDDNSVVISFTSLNGFGYICIVLGIIAIVAKILIKKLISQKEVKKA